MACLLQSCHLPIHSVRGRLRQLGILHRNRCWSLNIRVWFVMPCVPINWYGGMLTRRPQWHSRQMHSFVVRSRKVGSTVVPRGMARPHSYSSRCRPNVECGGSGGSLLMRHLLSRSAATTSRAIDAGKYACRGPRCRRRARLIAQAIVHSGVSGSGMGSVSAMCPPWNGNGTSVQRPAVEP
jgi:hypothetical protein